MTDEPKRLALHLIDRDTDEEQQTTDRLLDEVRSLHKELEGIRMTLARGGQDFHLLTTTGAIQLLLRERKEAEERIISLEKELNKAIRSSK